MRVPSYPRPAAPTAVFPCLTVMMMMLLGLHGAAHGFGQADPYEDGLVQWALGLTGLQRDVDP